ncbi:Glycolate dehydrogenase, FAD-binding subunit GlcE [hydrothermal vent metagenome]|uniref:Glycolate dehydrogenase, FAD-binding subunit GlcE n=1 Tax=hydrothermal vent metagenome TaxID=652676 RepID=A0A3B0X0N2_9ZZZZ
MSARHSEDQTEHLLSQVQTSVESKSALNIQGGNSKQFYGHPVQAATLDISHHQGIINYQPSELVITARAGTRLTDIESALAAQNQMLAFEPPGFSANATLGGTIACNVSGPRRASSGAARDSVLGCTIINGKAEVIHSGGEVMKNVAGYDVSRLMCGAMGTLGVLLDISLKVVPKPEAEISLVQQCDMKQALQKLHHWTRSMTPISASCFNNGRLYIRLSGSESALNATGKIIGGDSLSAADDFWLQLKEHQHAFFSNRNKPLWRLSLASSSEPLALQGETLIEWNGALRWLKSADSADLIRQQLETLGGHATLFKHTASLTEPFHELSSGIFKLHKQLKHAFDPHNIFNPGRMYSGI